MRNLGATDYVYSIISNVTLDTFDITNAVNSGATTGTAGAYIPAIKVSSVTQTGGNLTAATFTAPAVGNTQINKINQYTSNQQDTLVWTVPASLSNGASGFGTKKSINPFNAQGITVNGTGTNGNLTPTFTYNLGTNINQISIVAGWFEDEVILSVSF